MSHISADSLLIYAVCCQSYYRQYGHALESSAKAAGHQVKVFHDDRLDVAKDERVTYLRRRFAMLPGLLREHPHVLMVDADTVIRAPVEIEDNADLGIFLRPWEEKARFRTLASAFYCTDRAMPFAEALAKAASLPEFKWGDDQVALWDIYCHQRNKYRIKTLNRDFIDWELPTKAPIYTAKGIAKHTAAGRQQFAAWDREAVTC